RLLHVQPAGRQVGLLQLPVRRVAGLAGLTTLVAGFAACGPGAGGGPLLEYLRGGPLRREALLSSLWFRGNDYARLRLARVAEDGPGGWGRLPEWRPPAAPLRGAGDGQAPAPFSVGALPAPEDDDEALRPALRALGEAAFFDYPAQLVGGLEAAVGEP